MWFQETQAGGAVSDTPLEYLLGSVGTGPHPPSPCPAPCWHHMRDSGLVVPDLLSHCFSGCASK